MLNIYDLRIDTESLGNEMLLVGVKPYVAYRDGQPTDQRVGYAYHVVLPQLRYERMTVKIQGETQQIQMPSQGHPTVAFDNLEVKLYYAKDHTVMISATATGIKLASDKRT